MGCAQSQDHVHLAQLGQDAIEAIHTADKVVGTVSFLGSVSIVATYFAFPGECAA